MARAARMLFITIVSWATSACNYFPDHHLVHPREPPGNVLTWSEAVESPPLRIRLEGARPAGTGPFPAVLVHPEGGKSATDMSGVVWDLAARGYFAIAADYQRLIDGKYQPTLFAWRSEVDATALVRLVERYPQARRERIGLLGFSQGGVFCLLIAAYAGDRIGAVVSYYPVTDFPYWLREQREGWWRRRIFSMVRWYFRRQSGAATEAEFQEMLHRASAYYVAEAITAPVLLVHGERDTTAPIEESKRMADRLAALGKEVRFLAVPDAVHIFNFRQKREADLAWRETVEWLDHHLR